MTDQNTIKRLSDACREKDGIIGNLLNAMKRWGNEEDGIPDFACAAFNAAVTNMHWCIADNVSLQSMATLRAQQPMQSATRKGNAKQESSSKNLYRKKPVVIEARQLTKATMWDIYRWLENAAIEWCWDEFEVVANFPERYITIRTLEGDHKAQEGDYVIRGVKGEFYPCKPDIFELTYEAVDGSPSQHIEGGAP